MSFPFLQVLVWSWETTRSFSNLLSLSVLSGLPCCLCQPFSLTTSFFSSSFLHRSLFWSLPQSIGQVPSNMLAEYSVLINECRDPIYFFHCSVFNTKCVWHIIGVHVCFVHFVLFNMRELSTPNNKKTHLPFRNTIYSITHFLFPYQPRSFQ